MSVAPVSSSVHPLIEAGYVELATFQRAERQAAAVSKPVEIVLNSSGALADEKLAEYYSKRLNLRVLAPEQLPSVRKDDESLNPDFMRKHMVLPIEIGDDEATIGFVNPEDVKAVRGVSFALRRTMIPVILKSGDWKRAFLRLYEAASGDVDTISINGDELLEQDRDAPIVRKVAGWLGDAADFGASDIHFEARRDGIEVRYRIDGTLRLVAEESREISQAVLARIKVITGLDLGEHRRPQDGRATIVVRGRRLDVRASIVPSIDGESVVLRLLDRPEGLLSFDGLGFEPEQAAYLKSVASKPHGLYLVSGPTGSGKTTTMYACLETLRGKGLKILSIEDPVEYHFDHVTQVQVSEKAGVDFAGTLRSFLRHDPEVIMVGEIRDSETARTAVQAAYSGHFVIASIHAIDAVRVIDRLEDMGVDSYKLHACLLGSMAQRLVSRLCSECRVPREVSPDEADIYHRAGLSVPRELWEPAGCVACHQNGYKGRIAVCEFVAPHLVQEQTLLVDGLRKAVSGRTTLAEVMKLEGL